jgi:hypothetical protein
LKGFERRLERAIEGTFARAFKSNIRPVELGRRLVREMDDNRSVDVRGRTVVPNSFTIELSPDDHAQFAEIADTMARELAEAAREHARDEGYSFLGPVSVALEKADRLRPGSFNIDARLKEGQGGAGAGSLILPTGERIPLGERTITIGRKPESTIVLGDPNASRAHAEIRPHGAGFVMVDMGSTNGSRVNGVRVSHHELSDGDELTFGNTRIRFEAS